MSKAILISIQPKWVEKICNGEKTIEVRKSRPNLESPFKCYIYETKGKQVEKLDGCDITYYGRGKVIGEFVCDRIAGEGETIRGNACLTVEELQDYCNGKDIYFWHITDPKIYDKPKDLSEFRKPCPYTDGTHCLENKCEYYDDYSGKCCCRVERPPQSYMKVE